MSQSEHEFLNYKFIFFLFQGVKHFDFIPESYIIPEEFNEFNGKCFDIQHAYTGLVLLFECSYSACCTI